VSSRDLNSIPTFEWKLSWGILIEYRLNCHGWCGVYRVPAKREDSALSDVLQEKVIAARDVFELKLKGHEGGATFEWSFNVASKDIKFSVDVLDVGMFFVFLFFVFCFFVFLFLINKCVVML
jgi:hypothetical protein